MEPMPKERLSKEGLSKERLLVLEINELPKQVVDWWRALHPRSPLARLVGSGTMTETILTDELPRDLYPSQSWASLGMGVPYEQHDVFWYGDPKPAAFPFYWQAAADQGATVGLLGVLHTSPRLPRLGNDNLRFVVPDVFGDDASTVPTSLAPIQAMNLRLTRQSARVARVRLGVEDLRGIAAFARHGVRPATWAQLGTIAAQVGRRAWNKERLRVGQALLMADVFEHQVKAHDPDLAVLFSNHVASFMHRYWAATFPEDWADGAGYSDAWRAANADELPFAMRALDRMLERMTALAAETGRTLLVVSSMGQKADATVDSGTNYQAVIRDPEQFLLAAGVPTGLEVRRAMVPQLTIVAERGSQSSSVQAQLEHFLGDGLEGLMLAPEGDRDVMTFTYHPACRADAVSLGGTWMEPSAAGIDIAPITDHRSGRHSERGILISSAREPWPAELDARRFAPLVLDRLGLTPLEHHLVEDHLVEDHLVEQHLPEQHLPEQHLAGAGSHAAPTFR